MKSFFSLLLVTACAAFFSGCGSDDSSDVTLPTAAFTVQNNNCMAACLVTFTNTSQNATSYTWDFGDGETSNLASPTHTYTDAGTYTVTLTAHGTGTSTTSQTVTVQQGQYVTYKVNGTAITATDVLAVRGTTTPRTLTLTGASPGGLHPTLRIHMEEHPIIGFGSGLNAQLYNDSAPGSYVTYTNSNSVTATTTTLDSPGMHVGFLELNFTQGGVARGVFSGEVQQPDGTILNITEGRFRLLFQN